MITTKNRSSNGAPDICLVISSLGCGGAERIAVLLANRWSALGKKVALIYFTETEPFYPLAPEVELISLAFFREGALCVRNPLVMLMRLRRKLRQLHAPLVLSFLTRTNVLVVLACFGLRADLIVAERVHPGAHLSTFWRILMKATYRWADKIVVQTTSIRDWFPERLKRGVAIIPNPVIAEGAIPKTSYRQMTEVLQIVAVGRLAHEKGFDLLIAALAQVAQRGVVPKLTIWGEGALRQELRLLAQGLGVEVELPGVTSDIHQVLIAADLFVLPSRNEGFPNVLCEAMSVGLPCIAADCPGGPRDIITGGVDGLLVPAEDVEQLSDAIMQLAGAESLRAELGRAAVDIVNRYQWESVAELWDTVLGWR